MTEATLAIYKRSADESPVAFGKRLRDAAAELAVDPRASTVVVLVDDGETAAPPEATAYPSQFDGALLVAGVPFAEMPVAPVAYAVRRRVIKARARGRDGARSAGFTIICPSVRAKFLTHDQFDAHWRDNHSHIHVESSPGTCHYEQLIIDRAITDDAPQWDGVGLLSFANETEYTERLFNGDAGRQAIFDDIPRFLSLEMGETLPASEFVYRDET